MSKKLLHLVPKLEQLAKTLSMEGAANVLGLSRNQVMYLAKLSGISFRKKGSSHYKSTLDESDIPMIRQLHNEGVRKHIIARKFEVNVPVIEKILSGKNWAHVE